MNDPRGLPAHPRWPGLFPPLAVLAVFGALLGSPGSAGAQASQPLELPEYSLEQRWERAAAHVSLLFATVVRRELDAGRSPRETGLIMVDLVGGWPGVQTPEQMARALHRNWLLWREAEFRAETGSDGSVTITTDRPYTRHFGGSDSIFGISRSELDAMLGAFFGEVARRQGLEYREEDRGGQLIITIRPAR